MFIKIVEDESELNRVLNFIGEHFFKNERLKKYINRRIKSFSNSQIINENHLLKNPDKNTKIFAAFDENSNLIGGMTVKFYLWEKLKKQYFFNVDYDYVHNEKLISVNHLENIVKNKFSDSNIDNIKVSIELDTFAVKEELRGKGIGKKLYEKFIDEALKIPDNTVFAFTIVLGKYSKIKTGEFFMKYFFNGNSNIPMQKIPLKETLELLNLPKDIFTVSKDSYGTVILSKKFNFKFLGYAKYLGEIWGYIFKH